MREPITLNLSPQHAIPEREPPQFSAPLMKWLLTADACFLKLALLRLNLIFTFLSQELLSLFFVFF